MPETFEEFMKRVDAVLISACGVGHDDLVDANWSDLYDEMRDMRGDAFEEAVIETMVDEDDGFAHLMRENGRG